ncbi:hypothetical protein H7Y63_00665 [Polaromonas sp.]|nr:hypothetical protein [Candidatus Saccharibacteria bacterium]
MELRPLHATREAAWYALHKTGLAKLASGAINCFVPSRHVQALLRSEAEKKARRERHIVRGFGEFHIRNSKIENEANRVDPEAWKIVRSHAFSGEAGIKFGEIFDAHAAGYLEETIGDGTVSRPRPNEPKK